MLEPTPEGESCPTEWGDAGQGGLYNGVSWWRHADCEGTVNQLLPLDHHCTSSDNNQSLTLDGTLQSLLKLLSIYNLHKQINEFTAKSLIVYLPRNLSARAWSTCWLPAVLPFPSSLRNYHKCILLILCFLFSPSAIVGTVVDPANSFSPADCGADVSEHRHGELVPGLESVRDTLGL